VETVGKNIVRAEVSPPRQVRRGRVFVRIYASLIVLASAAFIALLFLVRDQDILYSLDIPITRAIQSVHLPLCAWVLTHVSDLGFSPLNIVSYVVVIGALYALGLRIEAALGLFSSVLAGLVGGLIKLIIRRVRPSGSLVHVTAVLHDYSFPSGHVIQYVTLFGFAFFVVWVSWRSSIPRNLVLAVLALLVLLVGPSRVYLGEHWPSDVFGAYCLAGLWLAGTIELLLALKRRLGPGWSGRPYRRRFVSL
jgi:undecaprenyl-diphosphatase